MKDFQAIPCCIQTNSLTDIQYLEIEAKAINLAGFNYPVMMTKAAYDAYQPDHQLSSPQILYSRLLHIFQVLRHAISQKENNDDDALIFFDIDVFPNDDKTKAPEKLYLKAVCSGEDNGEPFVTIMLPEED